MRYLYSAVESNNESCPDIFWIFARGQLFPRLFYFRKGHEEENKKGQERKEKDTTPSCPTPTPQETSMLLPFLGGEAKPQRVKRLSCHFGHCHQKKRPSKHIVTLNGVSYTARRCHYYYSITKLIWTRQKGKTIRFLSGAIQFHKQLCSYKTLYGGKL